MQENKRAKLSKSILDMKFMKKTKDRVDKEADDAEGQAMYSHEITEDMKKSGNILFIDTGIMHCKDLIDGRLSFGGMNPAIERLMSTANAKRLEDEEKRKEKDVTDIQMAKGYSNLVDTMGRKFQRKNVHQNMHKINKNLKKLQLQKPPPME